MDSDDKKLTIQKSLELLIEGVKLAQSKGVYQFKESAILYQALLVITTEKKEKTENL